MVKRKKPVPLAPPPAVMKSRKKARQVTSLFHKLTRQLDQAKARNDDTQVQSLEKQIETMGGREEYQRASQLSTKFHSTSKWVLGELGKRKWLHGIELEEEMSEEMKQRMDNGKGSKKRKGLKRAVDILEVGAINTELIDAGSKTKQVWLSAVGNPCDGGNVTTEKLPEYKTIPLYNLTVRAIDLKSSHAQIEEQDFLTLPVEIDSDGCGPYDVIVCSMVLNCVTNAVDRGKMLSLLYRQLRQNGLCFLTLPRLCLSQSKFLNLNMFEDMLKGVGFWLESKKESPKVAFWVLRRAHPSKNVKKKNLASTKSWNRLKIINAGKKFRNDFGVILNDKNMEA